jgi:hypothetical protein
MEVSAEEVVPGGRLDLRFRSFDWDVIVELKIHAGYGKGQLRRYLSALDHVSHSYLIAVTRDVPIWGEPEPGSYPSWMGSVQWRALLPGLRAFDPPDALLAEQWRLFLDVLETEGSMGFTRPDVDLFAAWALKRRAGLHVEAFVEAVRWPVMAALRDLLGGGEDAADFYRGRGGRPVLSRSHWGKADMPIRVPGNGPLRLRAGAFGWDPPARFYVTPDEGRRWVTGLASLPDEGRDAVRLLVGRGFRDRDLHAFLDLDGARLASPTLEQDVVKWVHARFQDVIESGLLSVSPPWLRQSALDDEAPPSEG